MVCIAGGVAAGFVYANLECWLPRRKPDEVNWNEDAGVVLQNLVYHRLEARRNGLNQIILQKGTDSGEQEFILTKPPPEFPPARFFLINFHLM